MMNVEQKAGAVFIAQATAMTVKRKAGFPLGSPGR
jgi:hypothetical protein